MDEPEKVDLEGHFALYADYARTLRLWLVAYGVGGPILFITRPEIADRVVNSGNARPLVTVFLSGVALQVLDAALNKWAAWYMYEGLDREDLRTRITYRAAKWFSDQFWFDMICDFGALVLFGWATVTTMRVFGL